jgi:CDP-diacylglycerol--glycerol-3-phosphate 3-phosphatidyltransferase
MGSWTSKEEEKPMTTESQSSMVFPNHHFQKQLFHRLQQLSQAIPITDASHVSIIREPSNFYHTLEKGIQSAQHRIYLSSLYLGTGKHEQRLVQLLHEALQKNSKLQVHILFDALRGTRGASSSASSSTLLLPLKQKYSAQVICRFYHTPELRGWIKRLLPERMNEVIGLQHMKLYLFDDDLLISGYAQRMLQLSGFTGQI